MGENRTALIGVLATMVAFWAGLWVSPHLPNELIIGMLALSLPGMAALVMAIYFEGMNGEKD